MWAAKNSTDMRASVSLILNCGKFNCMSIEDKPRPLQRNKRCFMTSIRDDNAARPARATCDWDCWLALPSEQGCGTITVAALRVVVFR